MYPYNNYMPIQPAPPQQHGVNWVQGIAGANAWFVAPEQTVFLMDSEAQTFYMKSADRTGKPSLRIFDFKERVQQPAQTDDYSDLVKRIEALETRLAATEVTGNG